MRTRVPRRTCRTRPGASSPPSTRSSTAEAERAHLASLPFEADVIKRLYGIDAFAWGRSDVEARLASVYEPTCNICGLISGFIEEGTKTVIPSEASVKIDFRLVPEQDPARIGTLLRAHLDRRGFGDVELVAKEGTRPYRGRIDDPLVRAAQAVAEEEIGTPALLIPSSGGTSPMWQVCGKRSLANVTLGMGHPGSGAHAPIENILLANYWRALRCRGRQGTTADERAREQEYLVDVVVRTDLADAVRSDDLASALDISSLARVVRDAVAERPRALVERITFDVARGVLARFPAVSEARVRVLKPHPDGLGADAEAVELVLRR